MNFIYPFVLPIAIFLVAYNSFLTGLLVLFKRRDEVGLYYLLFSLLVFGWGTGVAFMLNNDLTPVVAQNWGRFSQVCALFIPAAWLHFVLVYTGKLSVQKRLLVLAYVLTLAIFPFTSTTLFITGFREMVGVKIYPIPGPLYIAFTTLFVVVVVYSFVVLYSAWVNARSSDKKKDYKFLFFVQCYGFLTGSLSFLPVYGISMPQYNLLAMPLWQILFAYAVVRHRILNLEEIVQAVLKDKLAAIGTLATSINHEIRNPLYVIKGSAESHLANLRDGIYATKEEASDKSTEILQKAVEQAERAMEIIKRFALFAKQGTREEAQFEEVDLSRTFEEILPLVSHELELDKIKLIKEISDNLPAIHADHRHIEEILFNLIVNACQAMKNGGELTVKAEQRNGTVEVKVEDQGPGIASDQLSKIFEPFYTTKESGTGLGLYITKQLVERNGGRISVKSQLNKGTRFILNFPAENGR